MTHRICLRSAMIIGLLALALSGLNGQAQSRTDPFAWSALTKENKPWARWWWLGSAVDKANLTLQLEQFEKAGIGGVEICPIYGAKGYEDKYIDFLSPKWVEMVAHVTTEAKRLGLGVDMTTGTGWPFGGPEVTTEDSIAKFSVKTFDVAAGATFADKIDGGKGAKVQCVVAYSADGKQQMDLTKDVQNGKLDWTAPGEGAWKLYVVFTSPGGMVVKRPAPGGAGLVLDPYSVKAMDTYLSRFDKAFANFQAPRPRSDFHDSFEYANSTWTPNYLNEFQKRRGYDLRMHLPAFAGTGPADTVARVRDDYRQTISDLHLAYISRWTAWSHSHGGITRDQAHGAPANLIDIYGASDIPETEVYKNVDDRALPMMKFASSAAHLNGKELASAESFTWLKEHFQASLGEVKTAADFIFLTGINHVFFHGIPYSPKEAPWPGWQFYASVNFGPYGGLWHDLPEFNAYAGRVQSVLQAGKPGNDVLLYFPVHDLWAAGGKGGSMAPIQFTVPGMWMFNTPFHETALELWNKGYSYDAISDRYLEKTTFADGRIQVGGNSYHAIVVPKTKLMPETTLRHLIELAKAGATIFFTGDFPADVPGLNNLEERRAELKKLLGSFEISRKDGAGTAVVGDGLIVAKGLNEFELRRAGVLREPIADAGVRFIRRANEEGYSYFLVNRGKKAIDGWVELAAPMKSAIILDPLFKDHSGLAQMRTDDGKSHIYLQLKPGESIIVRTLADKRVTGPEWVYLKPTGGEAVAITGAWKLEFVEGGPVLPKATTLGDLKSWTNIDADGKNFSGTARYTIQFGVPQPIPATVKDWLLDLGSIGDAARVKINGSNVGTVWTVPAQLRVRDHLRFGGLNTLEVEVTNLASNRIADLDRRGVNWKYFRDANVTSTNGNALNASKWAPHLSGLMGPVRLIPQEIVITQP